MWASVATDDTGEATNWVTIYWMVYRTIANAFVMHLANYRLKCGNVLRRIAVEFNVSNMASVTEIVVWCLNFDFAESRDWVIYRYME